MNISEFFTQLSIRLNTVQRSHGFKRFYKFIRLLNLESLEHKIGYSTDSGINYYSLSQNQWLNFNQDLNPLINNIQLKLKFEKPQELYIPTSRDIAEPKLENFFSLMDNITRDVVPKCEAMNRTVFLTWNDERFLYCGYMFGLKQYDYLVFRYLVRIVFGYYNQDLDNLILIEDVITKMLNKLDLKAIFAYQKATKLIIH